MANKDIDQPSYKYHVFCCTNVRDKSHPLGCCMAKGSKGLRDYMKKRIKEMGLSRKIRINIAGCLDQCRLGPTMVIYPQAIWCTYKNKLDIDDIIEQHLIQGKVIERLLLSR